MELIELFQKGGLVMYPLLVCSIVAVAILVERIRTYRAAKSDMANLRETLPSLVERKDWQAVIALCEADGGCAAEMISRAAMQAEGGTDRQLQTMQGAAGAIAGHLRRYLNYLETTVTLAPLLGLLGTVTGMIGSFSVLSLSEGQPFAITGGVGEALIATATGLCVAIIALVIHAYLVQQEDGLITDMEELGALYSKALTTRTPVRGEGEQHAA